MHPYIRTSNKDALFTLFIFGSAMRERTAWRKFRALYSHFIMMLHVMGEVSVDGLLLLHLLLLLLLLHLVVGLRCIHARGAEQVGALPEERGHLHLASLSFSPCPNSHAQRAQW